MTSQTKCFPQPNAHKANYPNGFSGFHSIPNFGTTSLGSAKNVLLIETSYSTSYTHLTHKKPQNEPQVSDNLALTLGGWGNLQCSLTNKKNAGQSMS